MLEIYIIDIKCYRYKMFFIHRKNRGTIIILMKSHHCMCLPLILVDAKTKFL